MDRRIILVADDTPWKLASMRATASRVARGALILTAGSVRQAVMLIGILGERISLGLIDFDFEEERKNGGVIMRELRRANRAATIACVTTRPRGQSFSDAKGASADAGANRAICFQDSDAEQQLLALAA